MTLTSSARKIASGIIDSYDIGELFTTREFTEATLDAYKGTDKYEPCNTAPEPKVKHSARWAQNEAKNAGIIKCVKRGYWVKVA